ncbi:unnamed protein product, partial [marine sediment metagenome]
LAEVHERTQVQTQGAVENAMQVCAENYERIVTRLQERNMLGEISEEEVVVGTLGGLNCQPVPQESVVWLLPANELRNLQIVIDPPDGAPGDSLTFHIQFGLKGILFVGSDMVNIGFCDTEICLDNCLKVKEE